MDKAEDATKLVTATGGANLTSLKERHRSDDPVVPHQAYYPVSLQGKMHSHDRGQLVCATTFALEVVTDERRWMLQPGHAAWLPGRISHSILSSGTPGIFRSLYIRPDLASRLGQQVAVIHLSPLLREILMRLIESYDDRGGHGVYPHLAALSLDEIARAEPGPQFAVPHLPVVRDRRLKRICESLLAQPGDRRTLDDWGKTVGASSRTLERLFRGEIGMNFNSWRQACRVMAAIPRLQQGAPVQLVAWEVGYDSPSAFAEVFRRVVGASPATMHATH